MIRKLCIFLICCGLPVVVASLKHSHWTAYARPMDQIPNSGFQGDRLWKNKPDWIDTNSNYWKILQNPNTAGPRMTNWMQPENDFRITTISESRLRDWQFIPIRAVVEINNQSLIQELTDGRTLELSIFLPHPSTFDLIKYDLISAHSALEKPPADWENLTDPEVMTIHEYPAKIFRWKYGIGTFTRTKCAAVVDLPRYIRISVDQSPCSSTKAVQTLAKKLRLRRLLQQLGINEQERPQEVIPLITKSLPVVPTPTTRLR